MQRSFRVIIAIVGALSLLLLALVSLALASNATPANLPAVPPARPANPGSGVYTLYDTLTPGDPVTYGWIEIQNSADFVWDLQGNNEDNDVSPTYPIDFYFPFYDQFYTAFRVSENGFIYFGENVGNGGGVPDEIPGNSIGLPGSDDINNFIAPFAGNFLGYPGVSRVYVRNDSNPRRTIIEFENMVWCCGQYNPRTFEVILTPDGGIKFQYRKITNFPGILDDNREVRVGLENLDGSRGDVYYQTTVGNPFNPDDAGLWQDKMAIRFERSLSEAMAIFIPDNRRIWEDPGRPITVTGNLYLAASQNVTRSFKVMTSSLVVSSTRPKAEWANNITHTTFIPVISGTFTGTVQFVLTVPVNADLSDIATATFVAESVQPQIVSDTFTIVYGPAHRDLQIQKTLDPNIPPATPDGAFRYRLTITNTDYRNSNRAAIARGVEVTDTLRAGIIYEECRRPPNYQWCNTPTEVETKTLLSGETVFTWHVGTMGVDEVRTIYLELRNGGLPGGTNVVNTGHITLTDGFELGYPDRNSDSTSFSVDPTKKSELNVGKDYPYTFNGQNFVGAGQVIPFDIYYYNDGREGHIGNAPISATLVDLLPEKTIFDRATRGYNYTDPQLTPVISGPMSRTLTFNNLTADNGHWNRLHIRLWVTIPQTIPLGTRLTNTVTLGDGLSQDTDIEVVEVTSHYVDPFVDKGPSRDENGEIIPPEPGKDYTYWITYGNRSMLTPATDVIISDTLPASVTLVSASPGRYLTGPFTSTISGITVVSWSTNTLPPGATGQVIVIVHVGSDVPKGTVLVNQVVVTYTGDFSPSTPLDDTDRLTVEVVSDINDSQKLVNNAQPSAGATVEYTVVVKNTADTAMPFTVTDQLPAQLTYVSHDPPAQGGVTVNNGTISWTGGTVGAKSQETLTFRARVTETAQINDVIRNTANIQAGGASINRSIDVTVVGGVFGSSRKTADPNPVASGSQVTYAIEAINSGGASGSITVTDTLPASVTLVSNSFSDNVTLSSDNRTFTWTTSVAAASNKTLSFQVTVAGGLADGVTIDNVARLDDGGSVLPMTATLTIDNAATGGLYLPIIVKQ